MTYTFYLLGSPRLEINGQAAPVRLRKAIAILVYLAVTRQPQRRDALATLFWPEQNQRGARANLRRTLYELLQQLEKQTDRPLIKADDELVALAGDITLWTDIAAFQQLLAEQKRSGPITATPIALLNATELYTDDFLAGFTLSDAPAFDDWQFYQREELRQQLSTLLATLVDWFESQGSIEEAIHHARRWLQLDTLDERVHRRLMTLFGQGGQVAAAVRQYDECVRILAEELDVPPEEATTALFEAIRTRRFPAPDDRIGLQHEKENTRPVELSPPLPLASTPSIPIPVSSIPKQHNLPTQTMPFIGRKQEMAEITRRLADHSCHLLTLIGPGGIGKTRLAIEVARRLLVPSGLEQMSALADPPGEVSHPENESLRFVDGIFLVELHTLQSSSGVIAAIAEAIGFRFYNDVPPQEQLIQYIREKQMLLLLDNLEHLLTEADWMAKLVAELLTAAPRVKLLATSREALNLQEEWFHPLGGMRFSGQDHGKESSDRAPQTADTVVDAVQLFVQNARRARADFDLASEHTAVMRICRLVDGVPLALELAAAWLKVLPCAKIADEIEQNLDILTTRHQNIPSRHRSMRAVLEQSWQLLTPAEQVILERLAIFQRGFTQDAARTVADAALTTLAALTEKALVQVSQEGPTSNRYQLHGLLRQFVAEKLSEVRQEISITQQRHSDHYLQLVQQHGQALLGDQQQNAVQYIAIELDNIRAALLWTIEQNNGPMLLQSLDPLYNFYQIQSRYLEGKELFLTAIERWRASSHTDQIGESIELQLLARCGACCYLLCEYDASTHYLEAALALAEALDEPDEVAFTLTFLGRLAVWRGEKEMAMQQLTRSLTISQQLGDKNRTASSLEQLANLIYATHGDYVESKALAEQSLRLGRELSRPDHIAYALDTLGFVTFCLGEYGESEAYYRESLEIFTGSGDHYGQAMALGGLALIYWGLGGTALPKSTTYFQQSLAICREIGHHGQVSGRLVGLARVANDQGDFGEAERLAQEALTIARDLGIPIYLSHVFYCLGESAYQVGNLGAARAYILEALQQTAETGLLANLATILYHYAQLLVKEAEDAAVADDQGYYEAWQILTVVRDHPATWQIYRKRAGEDADRLVAILPASIASPMLESAQTLETIANAILRSI